MKLPTLLVPFYLVEEGIPLEAGMSFIGHVRVGPEELAVDIHVDNPKSPNGEDVYAVLIPHGLLEQLFEATNDAVEAQTAPEPRKDWLN